MKKLVIIRHDWKTNDHVVYRILNNEHSDSPDYFYMKETEEMEKEGVYGNGWREEVSELSILHFDIKPGTSHLIVKAAVDHDNENAFGGIHQLP